MNKTIAVLAVALFIGLAGCGGMAGNDERPSPSADAADETRGPDSGTEWVVTVTRVIDGDTIEVAFPNGETDTVRLLGVDTPETTRDSVTPEEFGIPDTAAGRDHLHTWGQRATRYATDTLANETVRIETDPDANRRGGFGRLLAYVYVDGENVNEQLLANGYARLYDTPFSMREALRETEREARAESAGLWGFEATNDSRPGSATFACEPISPGGRSGSPTEICTPAVRNNYNCLG
ncbi:thermonuclease family protein [Halorubrum laminariae]|uniref:Thermonuclease family protein n=1 Tax=Halorubrum laminariae TaxID=1433523 RepID=A0ABD6BZH1_9EURY|nr:thermonuclease family protein [Halorubrum laminariae]